MSDTFLVAALPAPEEPQPPQADTLLKQLYDWGLGFGESRATVRTKAGRPLAVATSTSANPYSPTTDTVTLMTYPGLAFLLVRAGTDGREFLTNLNVTSAKVALPTGLRIGTTTRQSLAELLGRPKNVQVFGDSTVVGFAVPNDETGEVIQFYFLADTLRKIRWVFYVD